MPQTPTLVPRLTSTLFLEPQALAVTVGAFYDSAIPRFDPDLPVYLFYACNLVSRQT